MDLKVTSRSGQRIVINRFKTEIMGMAVEYNNQTIVDTSHAVSV